MLVLLINITLISNLYLDEDDQNDDFFINVVTGLSEQESMAKDDSKLEWVVYLNLNNNYIEFKVDSGAQVNCISEQVYK